MAKTKTAAPAEAKPKKKTTKKAPDGVGYYYRDGKKFCWRLKEEGVVVARLKRMSAALLAEAVKEKRKELEESGLLLPAGKTPTLRQRINIWLETRIKPNRARNTYTSYKQTAENHIFPHPIAKKPYNKLDSTDAQALVATMQRQGLSGRTIELAITTICAAVGKKIAVEVKEGLVLPAKNPPRKRVLRERDMSLFFDELYRIQHFKTKAGERFVYRDRFLLTLILNTGIRISEALGIVVERVNVEEGWLDIEEQLDRYTDEKGKPQWELSDLKSAAGLRRISLNDNAKAAVRGQIALVAQDRLLAGRGYEKNGLLFATASGKPHSDRNVRRTLETVIERINARLAEDGLEPWEDVTLHDLRRTFLTMLARKEKRSQVIKAIAGHANIQTTFAVYALATEEDTREAAHLVSVGPAARNA